MNKRYDELRNVLLRHYAPREARAIALLVMEKALGLTPTDVYAGKVKHFSEEEQTAWQRILDELDRGRPVQYVLGEADFDGHTFAVGPGVLIPRPETAELVALVADDVATRFGQDGATTDAGACRIMDAGTGSGCIAVSLSLRFPAADITACDISTTALTIARQNAARLGARVGFERLDLLAEPAPGNLFDVIVSNPPYVTDSERGDMAANVLDHEPALALFVPDDAPLRFYHALARLADRRLAPGGLIAVEINRAYGPQTARLFTAAGLADARVVRDSFGADRFIVARRKP